MLGSDVLLLFLFGPLFVVPAWTCLVSLIPTSSRYPPISHKYKSTLYTATTQVPASSQPKSVSPQAKKKCLTALQWHYPQSKDHSSVQHRRHLFQRLLGHIESGRTVVREGLAIVTRIWMVQPVTAMQGRRSLLVHIKNDERVK